MKYIPLGLGCIVSEAIKRFEHREYSYPLDWLWSPGKTTYTILQILLSQGIDSAIEYMTTGYSYYEYLGNEHYISVNETTINQMNKETGLGITHFTIDDEYKETLRRRFERLLNDIKSDMEITFIYCDASNREFNYFLDHVELGVDATEYLMKIYELLYPLNQNIKIIYFCWHDRMKEHPIIQHITYDYQYCWLDVAEFIKNYLLQHGT
jgi:hypothetical protein